MNLSITTRIIENYPDGGTTLVNMIDFRKLQKDKKKSPLHRQWIYVIEKALKDDNLCNDDDCCPDDLLDFSFYDLDMPAKIDAAVIIRTKKKYPVAIKEKVEFDGYDWSELLPVLLGTTYDDECYKTEDGTHDNEKMLSDLDNYLGGIMCYLSMGKDKKKTVEIPLMHIRNFVNAVKKCDCSYREKLLQGLCDTEDDFTFVRYTSILLPSLWT